jgi:hypothetical protein
MDGVASHHGTLARFHDHSDRPLLSNLRIPIRRPLALIHPPRGPRHLPPKLKYKGQARTMMLRGRSLGALANCTRPRRRRSWGRELGRSKRIVSTYAMNLNWPWSAVLPRINLHHHLNAIRWCSMRRTCGGRVDGAVHLLTAVGIGESTTQVGWGHLTWLVF